MAITSYTWSAFSLTKALSGTLIGLKVNSSGAAVDASADSFVSYNLKKTGKLVQVNSQYSSYMAILDGDTVYVDSSGEIKYCFSDSTLIGKKLCCVTAILEVSMGISTNTTRAGTTSEVNLASLEPRDQFAMQAMLGLMRHLDHPENFDDANILSVCSAAYRWAQGMLQAAADSRVLTTSSSGEGEGSGQGSGVTRATVDTTSGTNSEKLLDNMVKAVDDLTAQVTAIKTSLQGTIKIDNPANDTFEVEGGGGSNINEILKYSTTPRKTCKDYIGFWQDENNQWFIGENTVEGLTAQIEAAQLVAANNSPYLWLRKKDDTTINSISTFMTAYGQAIFSSLKTTIDSEINEVAQQGFAVGGNWRSGVETIIAAKVKAEALNT